MAIEDPTEDPPTRPIPPRGEVPGSARGLDVLPALTIIWHPDLDRVGEIAPLTELLENEVAPLTRRDAPPSRVIGASTLGALSTLRLTCPGPGWPAASNLAANTSSASKATILEERWDREGVVLGSVDEPLHGHPRDRSPRPQGPQRGSMKLGAGPAPAARPRNCLPWTPVRWAPERPHSQSRESITRSSRSPRALCPVRRSAFRLPPAGGTDGGRRSPG
jgi:hypothetical protein